MPELRADRRTLAAKVALLVAPFVLYFALPSFVLFASGELHPEVDAAVDVAVVGERALVGYRFDESSYLYLKWKMVQSLPRRDVIALGSSRVLQFRERMFARGSFYNAGYTVDSVADFATFLALIPDDRLPSVLLVGLDQWMFNSAYDDLKHGRTRAAYVTAPRWNFSLVSQEARQIYEMARTGSLPWEAIGACVLTHQRPLTFGYNACVNDTGFENDGSMRYGKQIRMLLAGDVGALDHGFQETLGRIRAGNARFQHGEVANEDAFRELRSFLEYCRVRGTHVVAFLAPFPDAVYAEMVDSGRYGYLGQLDVRLRPLLNGFGFEFYDFSSFRDSGSGDAEAIDGFHGGELVYARMLGKMLDAGSSLSKYADSNALRSAVERPRSRYSLH